jgi:hypothetical protein
MGLVPFKPGAALAEVTRKPGALPSKGVGAVK